jgi:hypothetical protein
LDIPRRDRRRRWARSLATYVMHRNFAGGRARLHQQGQVSTALPVARAMGKSSEIKTHRDRRADHIQMDWQLVASAPFDRDLELAVIDVTGIYTLVFPCRRVLRGWINATTNEPVIVRPTHWREWKAVSAPSACAAS